jgi:threonine/homoserine/homoserine lactone efflux protein
MILFTIAFLPQFVNPGLGHVMVRFLVLGLTLVLMGLTIDASIGLLSGRLSLALRRSHRVARGLDLFSGAVFTGLAVRLIAAPE